MKSICPICLKLPLTLSTNRRCRFCSMELSDRMESFCCRKCEVKYKRVMDKQKRGERFEKNN